MYYIRKEFSCCSAHHLEGLPDGHPCQNLHGHNYLVVVELKSKKLNDVGFVEDYRALDDIKKFIDTQMDHKDLNEVFKFNPTAENLARHLFDVFKASHKALHAVEISETPKTTARFEL